MYLKKLWLPALAALVTSSLLIGCGPVQFSANSEGSKPVDPTDVPPTSIPNLRDVTFRNTVAAKATKLDVVLIIDDSNSMLPDNQKLASRLSNFVSKLQSSNIDWQMCVTPTRALPFLGDDNKIVHYWGASFRWQKPAGTSYSLGGVLKKDSVSSSHLSEVFSNTIDFIGAGYQNSDDERAIKAAYHHVYNGDLRYPANNSGCYRADSAVAYIIISDEDERSVGGDPAQVYYQGELKPLEREDQPQVFVDYFKEIFGEQKRFTVNSIIVKAGDTACKTEQDKEGAISHYGVKYAELSQLTGGGIGSICDKDYSQNLNLFYDRIIDSLSSVALECVPYQGNISVTITPNAGSIQSSVQGMNVVFSSPVPVGSTVEVRYQCDDNSRLPSSVVEVQEIGFFAKIWNFFKGLF